MRSIPTVLLALLCLSITVPMSGCSDGRLKTEPVRGVITLDGEPLAEATVTFTPKAQGEGAPGFARTNARGEYLLQTIQGNPDAGTLPGEYVVTVAKYKEVPTGRGVRDNYGEVSDEMESVLVFPGMETYTNMNTTPFSATVVKGRNQFDFDLKSE